MHLSGHAKEESWCPSQKMTAKSKLFSPALIYSLLSPSLQIPLNVRRALTILFAISQTYRREKAAGMMPLSHKRLYIFRYKCCQFSVKNQLQAICRVHPPVKWGVANIPLNMEKSSMTYPPRNFSTVVTMYGVSVPTLRFLIGKIYFDQIKTQKKVVLVPQTYAYNFHPLNLFKVITSGWRLKVNFHHPLHHSKKRQ